MFIPVSLATYLVIATTAAFYCVVAIWVVTSRRHWLVRTIAPLLALAALLPIEAHEPLFYFAMVMGEIVATTVAGRVALRLWRARPPLTVRRLEAIAEDAWVRKHFPTLSGGAVAVLRNDHRMPLVAPWRSIRFGLRDLFFAMVPAALSAWMASQVATVNLLMLWPDAIYASLWLAIIAVLSWRVFASRWKWLMAVLLVLAVARGAFVDAELLGDWLFASQAIGPQKSLARLGFAGGTTVLVQTLALYVAAAICILAGLAILALFRSERRRTVARVVAGGSLLVPMTVLAYVYWQMLGAVEIPAMPKLTENVYPKIVELAQRLEKADPRQVASIHEELLELLRRPGHVAVDWSQTVKDPNYAFGTTGIARYREVARSLQAAADNLHAAGKHDQAVHYDLAILKLGAMHLRGGLVIHALTGIAVEGIGTQLVAKHRSEFSPEVRRQVIAEFIELELAREPAEVTIGRDRAFEALAWRWRTRLQWAIDRMLAAGLARESPGLQQHEAALLRQQADEQVVLAEFAIGFFHDDHGRWPATLEELVPDYLPELPRDLHGSGTLVYRLTDGGYVLYSVSHDGRDDGGKFGTRIQSMGAGYDLNIDTIAK